MTGRSPRGHRLANRQPAGSILCPRSVPKSTWTAFGDGFRRMAAALSHPGPGSDERGRRQRADRASGDRKGETIHAAFDHDIPAKAPATARLVRDRLSQVMVLEPDVINQVLIALPGPGPRAHRGHPGHGQDPAGPHPGPDHRPGVQPHPVHQRPDALGHRGHVDLASGSRHLHLCARTDFLQRAAGRRDQPHQPRTLSCLLEAMENAHVSVEGKSLPVANPSSCWPPAIPSSSTEPTRCPKRPWTGSCCASTWVTPIARGSCTCTWAAIPRPCWRSWNRRSPRTN